MKKSIMFYNRIGFITLLNREIHRFMKVPVQTILAPLISNILYMAIFGGMLQTRSVGIDGVSYLHFLVPGLATMGAIFAAFQNPAFSIISQKFQNTIQDLNSYPISITEKILAFVFGGMFRGVLVGVLTYAATIFFVGYEVVHPLFFVLALMATSFVFASIGLIAGLILDNFEKMNFILAIIITPLTYLGGVFFEISKLPGFLSAIKYINPIFPLVNVSRYAYIGVCEGNITIHIVITLALVLSSFFIAAYVFKKGIGIKTI
ncbi:ABC transporter permease [Acetobacterium woodii]|uniref:Transport permease protein n=1 Tax=Acetobacterium woodii (strain ATCC 29683 / DSM 1030 / JCM 2381 / KCTC 1655 / WB1) TaxID=931626 RepID=H6LGX6_ACEWD|nr:ABC transporter permease [Acetobacterium woodii]AFA47114.1 ABC transport system permease protein [Acetobacterium woodii DSM 1030]